MEHFCSNAMRVKKRRNIKMLYLTQAVLIIVNMRSDLESSIYVRAIVFLFDLYMSLNFIYPPPPTPPVPFWAPGG